jgi:hypothetical protein
VVLEQINSTLGDNHMIIESIIGIVVTLAIVYLFWQTIIKEARSVVVGKIDVNKDGKTDIKDAKAALDQVVVKAVSVVDVNKDGKVNLDDVKAVTKKVEDTDNTAVSKTKKSTKPEVGSIRGPDVVQQEKPKRARNKGKLVADDPTTPEVNEAWEGGKAPEKTTKPKKPKKPKMIVAK